MLYMKTYVYLFLFQFGVPCSRPTTSSVCDEPLTDDDGESLVETPLSTGKVTLLNVLNEVDTPQINLFRFPSDLQISDMEDDRTPTPWQTAGTSAG